MRCSRSGLHCDKLSHLRRASFLLALLAIVLLLPGPAIAQVVHRCASLGLVAWGDCPNHGALEKAAENETMPCHGPAAQAKVPEHDEDEGCCTPLLTSADDAPVAPLVVVPQPPSGASFAFFLLPEPPPATRAPAPQPPIRGPPPLGPPLFLKNVSLLR